MYLYIDESKRRSDLASYLDVIPVSLSFIEYNFGSKSEMFYRIHIKYSIFFGT
jgi:hypothetical protein